jgi:hypothetical protein
MAATRKGRIIPKPKDGTRSVLAPTSMAATPVMRGEGAGKGPVTVGCGTDSCDVVLIQDLPMGSVQNIIVLCPKCQGYNEINI